MQLIIYTTEFLALVKGRIKIHLLGSLESSYSQILFYLYH